MQQTTQEMNNEEHVQKYVTNARVQLVPCDWDRQCELELYTHKGFRVTEKGKSDTKHQPGFHSIHSPLFGTDYSDEHAFEDRYSCECGRTIGKNNAEMKRRCPYCGHLVQFVDIDMTITGWIMLDRDYLIQPEFYKKIQTIIGQKNLNNIIKLKNPSERIPSIKYDGIGIIDFMKNFSEIMNYYIKKKPTKYEQFLFIMSHIDQIFVHCIPVYSSHLRPFVIKAEEIKYCDEDKIYKRLFSNSELLNDRYELARKQELAAKRPDSPKKFKDIQELRREGVLYSMQMDLNTLWDLSFDTIKKKTGTIRDRVLGGGLNYTARNVIIPDKRLRANEIELGYITFLELYKLEIISVLKNMYGLSYADTWSIWERATQNFDERVYKVMEYMVNNRDIIVEINRNPDSKEFKTSWE